MAGAAKKYEKLVKPYLDEIRQLRRAGAKFEDIASHLNISMTTFKRYRREYPELEDALSDEELNLRKAMANVAENSLFDKLRDRMVESEEILEQWKDASGKVVKQHVLKRKRLIPADTTAVIFALKNRLPDEWNKDEHELAQLRARKIEADIQAGAGDSDLRSMIRERLENYGGDNSE